VAHQVALEGLVETAATEVASATVVLLALPVRVAQPELQAKMRPLVK
jgi:hypothetical protein